jgi:hypothetical protein
MKQNKTYKSLIQDIDEKGIVIVAVNAFGNVDAQMDRSLKGSFDRTIKENIENIYWYKNHDDNEEPGIIKRLFTDDSYLMAELKFNLDKEFSRNLYSDYRFKQEHGKTVRHSIGVEAKRFKDNGGVRDVQEWKLFEVSSLTKWPANFNTPTLSVKNMPSIDLVDYFNNNLRGVVKNMDAFTKAVNDSHLMSDMAISNEIKNNANKLSNEIILAEIETYLNWIVEKGLHTDEFIKGFEKIYTGLRDQIKTPDTGETPADLQLSNQIDIDYLLNKI